MKLKRSTLNPYQHQGADHHAWPSVAPMSTSVVAWVGVLNDGADRSVGRRVRSFTLHETLFIAAVGRRAARC